MSAPPPSDTHHALPAGQRLDEYEIRDVIGVGGFGIVYRAFDHALEREVAIKEYLPGALAARSATLHVSVLSQGHAETFALGLKSFVNEARLLARFDHPSLVKVHRFWEAHGTAYMAMPLYRGRTLKALRAASPAPDEAGLRALLEPLLGTLEVLHAQDVFHRDIAPDNILVGDDGAPVLLDFGAARRVISDRSQTLTAILKPSYAPIEQYAEAEGLRQGPWTDLYALGATLQFAITGQAPQPATARALGSGTHSLAAAVRPGLSVEFLRIVDWMMAPRPEHRPQNVAALRDALSGAAPVPLAAAAPEAPAAWERTAVQPRAEPSSPAPETAEPARPAPAPAIAAPPRRRAALLRRRPWAVVAGLALVASGVAAGAWMATPAPAATPPAAAIPTPTTATEAASAVPSAAATPAVASDPAPAAQAPTTPPVVTAPAAPRRHAAAKRAPATPPAAEPEAAPARVAAASPREQCDGRMLLALHRCLKRVCESPEWTEHRDCRRMRRVEASAIPNGSQ